MISKEHIHLIINADDYGYFPCINLGILDAANSGAISATGILANSPNLHDQIKQLDACQTLDIGVHLNLTYGRPLTNALADRLSDYQGHFPSAPQMSVLLLQGKISLHDVRNEWAAQIEACQGRKLCFLNSHEHIHMFPGLYALTLKLAQDYQIDHVRFTQSEWQFPCTGQQLKRNLLIQGMTTINRLTTRNTAIMSFLGLNASGRLNHDYLAKRLGSLKPGGVYELMCHPGYFAANQINDPGLIAYHDWESELAVLKSPQLKSLYKKLNIRLTHYHELTHEYPF